MDYLVEFLDIGARVIKDPSLIEAKKGQANVLLNPDISHLKGVSPSFWVRNGETITHMGLEESKEMIFGANSFTHSFHDMVLREPPIPAQSKLETMVLDIQTKIQDIDARRISSVQGITDKMSAHMDTTVKSLADFDEKMKAMQDFYDRKLLLSQVTYFICLLGMFLLKFL